MSEDKREAALQRVKEAAEAREEAHKEATRIALQWVEREVSKPTNELEIAVMDALAQGNSVANVARAFTLSDRTPNRSAIYEIKNRRHVRGAVETYPFEWDERTVTTANGDRTVYDVVAHLHEYGPDKISGDYTWRYDMFDRTLEPVLTAANPYPTDVEFYTMALTSWLMDYPYPYGD